MLQYIILALFFLAAFVLMAAALHFSRYKKRPSGCCGGDHCDHPAHKDGNSAGCYDMARRYVEEKAGKA